jgi:hypothetical protein
VAFYLAGRNSSPIPVVSGQPRPANPYSNAEEPRANRYRGTAALAVKFTQRITTEPGKPPQPSASPSTILDRPQGGDYTLLPPDNRLALKVPEAAYAGASDADQVKAALENSLAELEALVKPVFYQDATNTFFIEPDVAERTVEQWEAWVQPTPKPYTVDLTQAREWQKQNVRPQYPRAVRSSSAGDWLTDGTTLVRFDEGMIGPQGQVPLTFQAVTRPGLPVQVNGASAIDVAEVAVLGEGLTLEQVGLVEAPGGLHVVGMGGVGTAMMNNFNRFRLNGSGAGLADKHQVVK